MIDYWKLTRDFKVGDSVQRYAPGQGGYSLSPFVGRVTCVHRGLGVIDIQFPYGNERVFPDDVVRVDSRITGWFPPSFDQTLSSWDTTTDKQASSANQYWRTKEVPIGFHVDLAKLWAKGASEVSTYDNLWHRYASIGAQDEAIREEVGKFYLFARNLCDLRFQVHASKTAAYWASSNRQYRATNQDMTSGKPSCPKCGTMMRKITYKMEEGARAKLFACPKDLFLVKEADILGPDGQPHTW